jgi:glycosyltransferase involved in cell wall biosynthesis
MSDLRSVLVPLPPVHWGGLQAFAATIDGALRRSGWRWIVVIPQDALEVANRLSEFGVDVIRAPLARIRRSPALALRSLPRLWSDTRALSRSAGIENVSIVQAVGAHHPHGALLARRLNKPLVWQIHSGIVTGPARWLAAKVVLSRSNAIMTNGRGIARAFWGRENLAPNHFVFYAPVDTKRFAPNPELRRELRLQLGYSDRAIVIGTVGNRVWQKNHEFLIKAAESLAQINANFRFLILGDPASTYKAEYEGRVENPALALNKKFNGIVRFLSPGREVDRWIHVLDIFTLTSHTEGVPIALFEAMSAAKPVLSADVGSIREVVEEGRTGFLYRPGDLSEYTANLLRICSNTAMLEQMGRAGRARIMAQFSLSTVVEAHIQAYEAAIRNFSQQRRHEC